MTTRPAPSVPPCVRPARVPVHVPVETAEPSAVISPEKSGCRLRFRLAAEIAPGAVLKLQLSGGRNNRGMHVDPPANAPAAAPWLTARLEDGTPLQMTADAKAGYGTLIAPTCGLRAGELITVTLTGLAEGGPAIAWAAQHFNKMFVLYRPDGPDDYPGTWFGDGQQKIVAACVLHVLGGACHHLRAYAPAQAVAGETIELLVRPEDEECALSHEAPGAITVWLDGTELPAEATPVPDSTCVRVRVQAPRAGLLRLRVHDARTGLEAETNPLRCTDTPQVQQVFWGMIHGHTEMSDGSGTLENYFRQMRDEARLDFCAPGDHDHLHETSDAMWRQSCEVVKQWHAPGRFVTLPGYEWAKWRKNGDGDRNVYYLQDDRPMYRSDEGQYPTPPDLFAALRAETAIVIPHHPGHSGNFCDWKDHDPACERLVEIYQVRGSYECAEEDNPLHEQYSQPPYARGFVRNALALGWRVGFTGGGDDHGGTAGTDIVTHYGDVSYRAGLMSVLATDCTREAIWDAMYQRRTVATSGPRILLDYTVNGQPLGSELSCRRHPELAAARTLRISCHGTAPLERIDIIRNNTVVHSVRPDGLDAEVTWEDRTPLAEALLPAAPYCPHPFCCYYVRVLQRDGEMAWASPVWIDEA